MFSKILDLIENNPTTWKDIIEQKNIKINTYKSLVCFKYKSEADFSDPIVCEARGIIIDIDKLTVVCRPFDKFFNYWEDNASKIDWVSALAYEKLDGSLIKLYWNDCDKVWQFATHSTCIASQSNVTGYNFSYQYLIETAVNYKKLDFNNLNKDNTYIFELVSPLLNMITEYTETKLYLLAVRNNKDGTYQDIYTKPIFDTAKMMFVPTSLHSVEDYVKSLNKIGVVKYEGVVVCDIKGNRIKVKTPEYLKAHENRDKYNRVTIKLVADMIKNGKDLNSLITKSYINNEQVYKYMWLLSKILRDIHIVIEQARAIWYEKKDRKYLASVLTSECANLAYIGFAAVDNINLTPDDALKLLNRSKLCKLLEIYEDAKT